MNWKLPGIPLGDDLAAIKKAAEDTLSDAKAVVKGGSEAARVYAEAWFDKFKPDWRKAPAAELARKLSERAADVQGCARAIVTKGRAWYVHGSRPNQQLAVCTLVADASAGAYGYLPICDVETDDFGNIVRYQRFLGHRTPAWERV